MLKLYRKAILPSGFKANGVACGLKRSGRPDLALFYSPYPAQAACKITVNKVKAAPVVLNNLFLKKNKTFHAIVANSGCANAFTGKAGLYDAREAAGAIAAGIVLKKEEVLTASTGIIGKRLDVEKIKRAVPQLIKGLSHSGINKAAQAIMTTDTFAKAVTVKFNIGGKIVTVCGVAKGSGMIAPHMATMLCFIFTDADITRPALDKALGACVENSFNRITVDGCMSTNDTVIVLANSASQARAIKGGNDLAVFTKALGVVCLELAKLIVRDGEGVTKFVHIKIKEAANAGEAKLAALAVANSSLFKCAIYASSRNIIGRMVAAIGASQVAFKEDKLNIKFSTLKKKDIYIEIRLARGRASAEVFTSDLTPEYVKINAEYN